MAEQTSFVDFPSKIRRLAASYLNLPAPGPVAETTEREETTCTDPVSHRGRDS